MNRLNCSKEKVAFRLRELNDRSLSWRRGKYSNRAIRASAKIKKGVSLNIAKGELIKVEM